MARKLGTRQAGSKKSASAPTRPPDGVVPAHWDFIELGREVAELARLEGIGSKAAARKAHERFNCGEGKARAAHCFFARFGLADLIRLGRIKTREGKPLTVTHLHRLAMVGDKSQRKTIITGLAREGWTIGEFEERIKQVKGVRESPGGRPRRKARSLAEALDKTFTQTEEWLKSYRFLWTDDPPPDGDEEKSILVEKLERAKARVRELSRSTAMLEKQLISIETRLGKSRRKP
ncbi:hypothetical protein V5E97_35795 [Singulisphaera sp. Ch08]|uniref:Uncharacterized protein n=1 Tax=Singulisphaera sp. Ch08 TaxID=3120278 RepID=A0AAU7CER0_9BACT